MIDRFVIYGAGGIGGVLGARLHQSGRGVALIARGRHLEAIGREGLGLVVAGGAVTRLPIRAVGSPDELELTERDVVILAVKSQDTDSALRALSASAPCAIPVVCAQNGVDNERAALRLFENVYGMCVTCPTGNLEAGIVEAYIQPITGRLDLGRYPHGVDEAAEEIAAAIRDSTYHCDARADIMRAKYRKLILNIGNSVWALTGRSPRSIELAELLRQEAEAVLDAAGIEPEPADEFETRLRSHRGGQTLPPTAGSTWQSFHRGTGTTEAAYLNGEIALLARLHDAAAPLNAAIVPIAEAAARERRPPESYTPDELWELVTR
jgi:2-dehydropantoate 2-reductase